jgi:hypothetical protein
VLVVCSDEEYAASIMAVLFDSGYSAVGPAQTAGAALAMAAQTMATVAVVAHPPTGKRGSRELAATLMRDWNIGSLILCDDGAAEEDDRAEWVPHPEKVQGLRRLMRGLATTERAGA